MFRYPDFLQRLRRFHSRNWVECADLLYPRQCAGCHRVLTPTERGACLPCLNNLPTLHWWKQPPAELQELFAAHVPTGIVGAQFIYGTGRIRRLVRAFKYGHQPELAYVLGRYVGTRLRSEQLPPVEALIPVPLHPRKHHARTYNQAERLAAGLGQVLGLPVRTNLVKRVRDTVSQTTLTGQQRRENLNQAFQLAKRVPFRHVALVDDVLTTGTTLLTLAQALQTYGSVRISILALAAVKPRKPSKRKAGFRAKNRHTPA
jgi:ComF family protein